MTIGIVIAAWQRHSLLRMVLRHLRGTVEPGDIVSVVGSEPESLAITEESGFEYVSAPNQPLSNKRNRGLAPLRGRVDAVVVLNSDDFLSKDLLEAHRANLPNHPVMGLEGLVFLVMGQRRFYVWPRYKILARRINGLGPGRAIRADVLDRIDWQLWPRGKSRNLDGHMASHLPPIRLLPIAPLFGLVDVKAPDTNITSWHATAGSAERLYSIREDQLPFPPGTFEGLL